MPSIDTIVAEHVDEASFLWLQRQNATDAPNYSPKQFDDLDERLEAHVDGLRVAEDDGWTAAEAALDLEGPEDVFAAAVLALEARDQRLDVVCDRVRETPPALPGLVSALGWIDPEHLAGRVPAWLVSRDPLDQVLGLAACGLHRRDPGVILANACASPSSRVRARAMRTAGELGRIDLLPQVLARLEDPKREVRFRAAWAGVLLGNRGVALDALASHALEPGPWQRRSLLLAVQAMSPERGHELLTRLAGMPDATRFKMIGAGLVGDVRYVPWLIDSMRDPLLARVALEAFVFIAGADVNLDQLEAMPPADFEDGPTDDPADENVEVPEDVALPWPDVDRVTGWWARHGQRLGGAGRAFLGTPVCREACTAVLRDGFQRQRVLAAQHLTLMSPGATLFPTAAPSRRQRHLLATA